MDLQPDTQLRIVVPVKVTGSPNLIGYDISHYAIQKQKDGKVRLRFTTAEITRNGKTVEEMNAPTLPFPLPDESLYIRLVYLTRSSQADHNMAITTAKKMELLNTFTNDLKQNPTACKSNALISCTWVPAGIAVRPE